MSLGIAFLTAHTLPIVATYNCEGYKKKAWHDVEYGDVESISPGDVWAAYGLVMSA